MKSPVEKASSVWELSAASAPATTPLDRSMDCSVAIVGAGYTGLHAAVHLASEGQTPVVLEAGEIGHGASGRNGGQVVPGLKHDPETLLRLGPSGERLVDFAGSCAEKTFEFIRANALDCDASQTGWVQPAVTPTQLDIVLRRAEQWRRIAGVDTRILDRDEVRDITGTNAYLGGWIDPRGGRIQPLSYARELGRLAIGKGAQIHTRSPVESLARKNGGWLLRSNGYEVTARNVIIATNGYRQPLLPELHRSIFPSHSVQIATEPLDATRRSEILPAGLPVSDSRRLLKYFRFDADGRFIIGGRGSFGDDDSGRHFAGLRAFAQKIFPQLEGVRWEHRWAGKIALTLDHLPHVHNPERGLYAALGYNGRGVALASQTGILLGRLVQGMPHHESPLPVTDIRRIPLHIFRRPALEAAVAWYRLLDQLGR